MPAYTSSSSTMSPAKGKRQSPAKRSSAPKRQSAKQKSKATQEEENGGALRYRRGYSYIHSGSGKKVVVAGGYIDNRSLKPEGSAAYQARRASEQKKRSSASKRSAKCANAPTVAQCARQGRVLREGSAYKRKDGTEVVRCASCVADQGKKGKGGPVKIYVESGTLYPYELDEVSAKQRHQALEEAIERLADEHKEQNPSLSKSAALELAANTARQKLQVLSLYRKNAAKGTVQGEQCVKALQDEDWVRKTYGLNPLDYQNRTCFGRKGAVTKNSSS